MNIEQILSSDDLELKKALFQFDSTDTDEVVILKANLWSRHFFSQYFKVKDAPFHKKIDSLNLKVYRATLKTFADLAFRGAAKTTKTKLFVAFVIANDMEHSRRYFKVLSHDTINGRQFVTDIYNMLIDPHVKEMYPEIFAKTDTKREETMGSFTTATGVKVVADTVGSSQRGAIQEDARPDVVIFDDFETRETLRSAVKTKAIWDNMQEAKDGLSYNGGCIYLGNYISELGNVHRLVEKQDGQNEILLTPIIEEGEPTWASRYTKADIEAIKRSSDDFEGEYLCKPSASMDVLFDRERLEKMENRTPIDDIAGFRIFYKYNRGHRYALGGDIAGGVGLDSSASVIIDFSTIPAKVTGTYASNTILPEAFGDEMYYQANKFGGCLVAPENNKFDQAVLKAKQLGADIFKTKTGTTLATSSGAKIQYRYGWNTNSLTRSKMFFDLKKAIDDGLLDLSDERLKREAMSFSRNELIDTEVDARLTTRHFDLLTACAIAWQMKDFAELKEDEVWVSPMTEEIANPAE